MITCIAISLTPYRGHLGPSGSKSKKSRKQVPSLSAPGSKKVEKKSKKRSKTSQKQPFFSRPFQPFFRPFNPGAERPRNLFSTFLGFQAQRAQMTTVRGQGACNTCNYFCFRELIFWWLRLQLHFLIPRGIYSREMQQLLGKTLWLQLHLGIWRGTNFANITLTITFFNLSGILIVIISVQTVFTLCLWLNCALNLDKQTLHTLNWVSTNSKRGALSNS